MTEVKTFPGSVVASLATGISLCTFEQMHEAAEHVAGHPIWTHEFARESLWSRLRDLVAFQCPWVLEYRREDIEGKEDEAKALAARLDEQYPAVELRRGDDQRKADPLTTLHEVAGGKPVLAVITDEDDA